MSLSDKPVVTLFSLKVAWSGKSLIFDQPSPTSEVARVDYIRYYEAL